MFVAALLTLPVVSLVIRAAFVMAQVEADLRSFGGFDEVAFKI